MTNQQNPKVIRNIIIFYVGAMLLAIGGGIIAASGQDVGNLLFILSPLVMVLIVRFLLGDGWKDADLGLKFKENQGWYLFAVLMGPVVFALVTAVNALLGFVSISMTIPELLPPALVRFAMQLVPGTFFAMSEEWGWRGYLEPRFAQLGMPALRRHFVIGVLWGVWHVPYILSPDYTGVPFAIFFPLFMVAVIFLAIIFGQIRTSSGSVWPVVFLHGVSNAVGFAILGGNTIGYNNELFGAIVPGGITITLAYGLIAFLLLRRRNLNQSSESENMSEA